MRFLIFGRLTVFIKNFQQNGTFTYALTINEYFSERPLLFLLMHLDPLNAE